MSKAKIHVVYDGEAVQAGSMDVRELAPALLSIGELCQQANRILNGPNTEIVVRVRSDFQRGSFGVDLEVIQTLVEQAKEFLLGGDYKAAKEIVEILFGSSGLIALVKWLRGRKEQAPATTLESGNIQIQISDAKDSYIEVRAEAYRIYQDPYARKAVHGVVKPLQQPGIDRFEVREDDRTITSVTRNEAQYFMLDKSEEATWTTADEIIPENTRTAALEIVRLSFREENKWVFSDGSGGTLNAAIKDEEFWEKLNRREITFGKGDILKVTIQQKTFHKKGELHTENSIIKVLGVITPRQLDLFKSPPDQDNTQIRGDL